MVLPKLPTPQSSGYTPEELEALDAIYWAPDASGLPAFIEDKLYIQPKDGGICPLKINHGQWKLIRAFQEQWRQRKPVRIIVLKARQIGFSTIIQAINVWYMVRRRNVRSLVIAHEREASANLYEIFTRYLDHLEPEFRPMEASRNNALLKVRFDNPDPRDRMRNPGLNSQFSVETAEDPNAGRSGTYQFIHASEVAFWPHESTFTSLLQTIGDHPETVLILESTANGAKGAFYEMWRAAERGESDFMPIFVAWWEHPEYCDPSNPEQEAALQRVREALVSNAPLPEEDVKFLELDEDELDLIRAPYGITFGQLLWRRRTIRNRFRGNVELFKQEFPANPDEAFLFSGQPWFDTRQVIRIKEELRYNPPEVKRYRVNEIQSEAARRPVLEEDPFGELWVWVPPVKGRQYVIGADVASGEIDGDADCAYVMDVETMEHCAELYGRWDTDTYARKLHWLGIWYNRALLGVELNGLGHAAVQTLERYTHYPNLYGEGWPQRTRIRQYGWSTTPRNRPFILDNLRHAFREGLWKPKSLGWYDEALTFVEAVRNRPRGEGTSHDDRIMASAIALELREILVRASGHRLRNVVNLYGYTPGRPRLRVVPKHPRW